MRTVQEIIDELLQHSDQNEVQTVLANNDHATLKTFRSKQFAAGKTEGKKESGAGALQAKVTELETQVTDLTSQLDEAKKAVPNLAEKEKEWQTRTDTKLKEKDKQIASATETLQQMHRRLTNAEFVAELEALGVHKDYASEVLTSKHRDRLVIDNDGLKDVLKPGETTGYEASDNTAKLKLLAADVAKNVPATFKVSKADRGGGVRGGAGQGNEGPSVKTITDKKASTGDYSL